MLASTLAANPDRIDRGSGLLKRFPGHLVNLDRPALRSCSARRIRRVVSAIDLSSQPTSSPFFYPSPVRPAQADARDRESGNRFGSSPCHWRWCQRRFERPLLTWRRSAVASRFDLLAPGQAGTPLSPSPPNFYIPLCTLEVCRRSTAI